MQLLEELKRIIKGEVTDAEDVLKQNSQDASIFEIKPQVVVFPKNSDDIKKVVRFVTAHKSENPALSITARSGGTDMTGGAIGKSIILSFTKYFDRIGPISNNTITAESGVFYRNFEKETLKQRLILPSYPASKEICAIGGMVNNNSGGEKSLVYGQTRDYIRRLKVILSDGEEYEIKPLDIDELDSKTSRDNFEGNFYRKISTLVKENYDLLQRAKPKVSKNSAGYYLWDVWNKEKNIFDLTQLFAGAQGTLGLVTETTFQLIPTKKYSRMAVVLLHDLEKLAEITNSILPIGPESIESYDDKTFKLAVKFFPSFAKQLGGKNIISLAWQFLPELWLTLRGGIPKLVLLVEFSSDNRDELEEKLQQLKENLKFYTLKIRVTKNQTEAKKYWTIRRESFNLLRQRVKGRQAAAFIDDLIVPPESLDQFLPELNAILSQYDIIYTIAGHVGNGNFHIIPLMNLALEKDRAIIPELSEKVYNLVLRYHGSLTGEHNDGLIRTPYLKKMFGEEVYKLFEETKKIFDPQNIFNPGKKIAPFSSYMDYLKRK